MSQMLSEPSFQKLHGHQFNVINSSKAKHPDIDVNHAAWDTTNCTACKTQLKTLFVRPMQLSHKTTVALTDSSASKTFHE
jgi:hypothetical protein